MMTPFGLVSLLMLGALPSVAQTLTCTFQFPGSGTVGARSFTNAAITIVTVGDTSTRQASGDGGYHVSNTAASISISGVGTFQFTAPLPPTGTFTNPGNPAPGATVSEYFTFGSSYGLSTALVFGISSTSSSPWSMLTATGPTSLTLGSIVWTPMGTSGGALNLYNTSTSIPMTFQAALSSGSPTPVLTRAGVLSHIAAGGGWTTAITIINTSLAAIPVLVTLHGDTGAVLTLPVTTVQQGVSKTTTTSSINATINPNATLSISTGDQVASTVIGWADVLSAGPVRGYAIFRSVPQSGSPSEGTVPLQIQTAPSTTLPFDNASGFVTGLALANLSTAAASLIVTIWDDGGAQLGIQFISIPGEGHTAFALPTQFPITAGKRGIIKFQATDAIAGIGLRFSPFGTFTSVPTL